MLEALHLTKIYKTKGGADVKALDDVSIQFPEKGMVFLLGKSGSGKSTLLNVCGGLDAPTSGEIIVKGRSSQRFTQSDFDSYRNTYVGFIFQEYNILHEFTVEDNIALALELQGKPKDKKVIAKLLEQVDLIGYAKRKPNTLSGGQKQRIAIARALVKSPEIIMADEPTGALDSATGKQVFDTLKKLSKEKLVIVVSHDRDFAEMYGDRIIELKDGKVISDVTKTQEQQQVLTENISIVGDTLCVKNGAELSDADFEEIKAFLSKTDKDVIIASGERDVKTFKDVSHIKDNGEKEVFKNSDEIPMEKKEYTPQDSRFIRSKLPLKHALKIGVSGMKTKPIRLVFTILLCTIAFTFFGLLSTMTFYDSEATFKSSLQDSNYDMIKLGKVYRITETWTYGDNSDTYDFSADTRFSEKELEELTKIYGENVFGGVSTWSNLSVQSSNSKYWMTNIYNFAYLPEEHPLREKIEGEYPVKDDEICISSYTAGVLYNCKAFDPTTGKILELSKPEDIIGKKIAINGQNYKVTGIFDSGKIDEKYDVLKESDESALLLEDSLWTLLNDSLHLTVFTNKDAMLQVAEDSGMYSNFDEFSNQVVTVVAGLGTGGDYIFPEYANARYGAYSKYADANQIAWLSNEKELGKKEVIVSPSLFYSLVMELYEKEINAAAEAGNMDRVEFASNICEITRELVNGGVEVENKETNKLEFQAFTDKELQKKQSELIDALKKEDKKLTLAFKLYNDFDMLPIGETEEFTIVGVWNNTQKASSDNILFDDKVAAGLWEKQKAGMEYYSEYKTEYVMPEDVVYGVVFLPYDCSAEQTDNLWKIFSNKEYDADDTQLVLTSNLTRNLESVDSMVKELSKIFLYVGIVLAVFAALLLSNFITVSISYKKQEIGILRAVGARSLDVFKIFFSESFVITAICVAISIFASVVGCALINEMLIEMIGASLFVFGIVSLLVLIIVALVTVVVATFLPVWNAAKKKPVESIRAL